MNTPAPVLSFEAAAEEAALPVGPGLALGLVQQALANYREHPAEPAALTRLRACLRNAAEVVGKFPRQQSAATHLHEVFSLVRELGRSGAHDLPVCPEDLARAEQLARRDWRGMLAAMLLVPAWQWPAAPVLAEVPGWLQPDFVRWLFTAPWNFHRAGQAETYARFHLQRLEELMRWLRRSPDVRAVVPVLGAYASHASLHACALGGTPLSRHAELRAQLLQRLLGQSQDHYRAPLRPRADRRLRVGIIHKHFADSTATQALRPLLASLDPQRCEVLLFAYVSDFGEVEEAYRREAADFRVLPQDLKAQLALLREAALDVVLFAEDLSADCNVVTRLALHRVAPLQACWSTIGAPVGLPEIDLRLMTTEELGSYDPWNGGERPAVLPGFAWQTFSPDVPSETALCSRFDFGLPDQATVYVSTADYTRIIPEVRAAWAQELLAKPDTFLLLHPFAENPPPSEVVMQFYQSCEAACEAVGVDPARLVVSTVAFPSPAVAVRAIHALGNVRLDARGGKAVTLTASSERCLFGELMERAYDALIAQGRTAFRSDRRPFLCPVTR